MNQVIRSRPVHMPMPDAAERLPLMNRLANHVLLVFPPQWRNAWHVHEEFVETLVITKGRIGLRCGDETMEGIEGSVFTFPSGHGHEGWCIGNRPVAMYCLWWRCSHSELAGVPISTSDRQGRVRMLAEWLLELSIAGRGHSCSDDLQLFENLIDVMWQELRRGGVSPIDERLEKVLRFIDEDSSRPMSVSTLARLASMSAFHFVREFRRAVGQPPMSYIMRRRADAAMRILMTTTHSLRQIADQTGFSSANHLSAVFKKLKGFPPSTVRRHMNHHTAD